MGAPALIVTPRMQGMSHEMLWDRSSNSPLRVQSDAVLEGDRGRFTLFAEERGYWKAQMKSTKKCPGQRGMSCIMSRSRGRRVILAWGTGGGAPRGEMRQRWARVVMEKTPSIQAKLSPMHWRLPAPKGK